MSGAGLAGMIVVATLLCSVAPHPPRLHAPQLVLWAWERPEELGFIDPQTTGVAFLAATISVQMDGTFRIKPRLQPLYVPLNTSRIAVARIETPPHYIVPDIAGIVDYLRSAHVTEIDFDARNSERPFYRTLLAALRSATREPVTITALASWCAGDRWIDTLPVGEAIPMFFRMGRGEWRDIPLESRACRSAIGLSTDEPWPIPKRGRRVYVFSPSPWTKKSYTAVLTRIEAWR